MSFDKAKALRLLDDVCGNLAALNDTKSYNYDHVRLAYAAKAVAELRALLSSEEQRARELARKG